MLANKHFLINEMRSGLGSILYYIVRSEGGAFPNQALKIFSCICVCFLLPPPQKKKNGTGGKNSVY